MEIKSYPVAKISAGSIVVYNKAIETKQRSEAQLANEANLRSNEFNGYMSPKTKCKVRKMLDTWITSIELRRKKLNQGNYYRNSKITFLTLTLSSQQVHDDNYIKRNLLNRFIIEIQREWKVNHYFWRAEPQENGNIHFHIMIDRYVHWRTLRDKWNSIQKDFGYIEPFIAKFLHNDPNSTDIKGLEKIRNVSAYVIKYCCKVEGGRKIDGRIWGCSDSLRKLTCLEVELDNEVRRYIDEVEKDSKTKVVVKDEFTLIFCNNEKKLREISPHLNNIFLKHYEEMFQNLYTSEGRKKIQIEIEKEKQSATYSGETNRTYNSNVSGRLVNCQLEIFLPRNLSAFN